MPAAGAPGSIALNQATAEQLQTLSGVGPAAARRIVAYRDEYGDFESIEDLAKVEGFDAQRVAGLRAQLRL